MNKYKSKLMCVLCCCVQMALFATVSGCGTPAVPVASATSNPEDVTGLDEIALQEKLSGGNPRLERKVMAALNKNDPYSRTSRPKAVRYESAAHRVVVTIWSLGDKFSEQQLADYREVATKAAGGIDAVIEVDNGDPPRETNLDSDK